HGRESVLASPPLHGLRPFPTRRSSDLLGLDWPEEVSPSDPAPEQPEVPAVSSLEELREALTRAIAAVEQPPAFDVSALSDQEELDRKSTRLNSSHVSISYAVFCLHTTT